MARSINYRGDSGEELLTSLTKKWAFGTRMHIPGERVFRYARAGEALSAGDLVQATIPNFAHQDKPLSSSIESTESQIPIVVSADVSIEVNFYKDGTMYVHDGAGEARVYNIRGNKAIDSALSQENLQIVLDTSVDIALDTTTRVSLRPNEYSSVLTSKVATIQLVVGAAQTAVVSGSYFWAQTFGPAAITQDSTLVPTKAVQSSRTIDGAVVMHLVPTELTSFAHLNTRASQTTTALAAVPGDSITKNPTNMTVTIPTSTWANDNLAANIDLHSEASAVGVLTDQIVGYVIQDNGDTEKALIRLTILN